MASARSFHSSETASTSVFDTSLSDFLQYPGALSVMFVKAFMYVGLLLSNLCFSVGHIPTHTSAPLECSNAMSSTIFIHATVL